MADFRAYFFSHEAFVARRKDTGEVRPSARERPALAGYLPPDRPPAAWQLAGIFYIKPNFPGRASHICNGGFCVPESQRRQGVARAMAEAFLYLARDLGYRASMFNLVSPALLRRAGLLRKGSGSHG